MKERRDWERIDRKFSELPDLHKRILGYYFRIGWIQSVYNWGDAKVNKAAPIKEVGERVLWHLYEHSPLPVISEEEARELFSIFLELTRSTKSL